MCPLSVRMRRLVTHRVYKTNFGNSDVRQFEDDTGMGPKRSLDAVKSCARASLADSMGSSQSCKSGIHFSGRLGSSSLSNVAKSLSLAPVSVSVSSLSCIDLQNLRQSALNVDDRNALFSTTL